ncbi:MAG: hypothetical protein ACKO5K_09515 [Armatimonadota bacterium]
MEPSTPWPRCPEADAFFRSLLDQFVAANPALEAMRGRLAAVGVDIAVLVDHWVIPEGSVPTPLLADLGLVETRLPEGDRVWRHPGARLPALRFKRERTVLALGIESIEAFAEAHALNLDAVHGETEANYRCGHVALTVGELMPIERRGTAGYAPSDLDPEARSALPWLRDAFDNRPRTLPESDVVAETLRAFDHAARLLGKGRAVEEFFASERRYYFRRNALARWQGTRQSTVGIGWANHDHHTYRTARPTFRPLIQALVHMGFVARERFHAGPEAGWGAQILDHPDTRVVVCADVDLAPEESEVDFTRTALPDRATLGTIGLWCGLHGSSIATAGLHHLECEFLHDIVRDQCIAAGGGVMSPFTDLPMLRQSFTEAEIWSVDPARLDALVASGRISKGEAQRFQTEGAKGSHLEILQRWEGYKGFDKTSVSGIIRSTDARRN